MSIQLVTFIVLVVATFYHLGVQMYIHFETYPLIPFVGKKEFKMYLDEYERRLTIPLLLPYGIMLLSNFVLLFIRFEGIPLFWVITAFILNLLVTVLTIVWATPVYTRIKQAEMATSEETQNLLRINVFRLLLSALSSFIVVFLLMTLLAA